LPADAELDPAYRALHDEETNVADPVLHIMSELVRINLGEMTHTAHPAGGNSSSFTVPLVDLDRILSAHLGVLETGRQTASMLSVVIASVTPKQMTHAIVQFLWSELRACDLVVPVEPGRWALCISAGAGDLGTILRRVESAFQAAELGARDDPPPVLSLRVVGTWPLSVAYGEIAEAVRLVLATSTDERNAHNEAMPITPPENVVPMQIQSGVI
jgi:hypothetical protein